MSSSGPVAILLIGAAVGGSAFWILTREPMSAPTITLDPVTPASVPQRLERLPSLAPVDSPPVVSPPAGDAEDRVGGGAIAAEAKTETQRLITTAGNRPPHVEAALREQRRYVEVGVSLMPRDAFLQALTGAHVVLDENPQMPLEPAMAAHLHDALSRALGGALMRLDGVHRVPLEEKDRVPHRARQVFAAIAPDTPDLLRSGRLPITLRLIGMQAIANRIIEGMSILPERDAIVYRIDRGPWGVELRVTRSIVPDSLRHAFDEVVNLR